MTHGAIGIARVSEGEYDTQVAAHESLQGALDLRKAARCQRWWVSFEDDSLSARQQVEPMSALKGFGEHLVCQVSATRRAENFLDAFAAGRQDLGGVPEDDRSGCQQLGRQRNETFGEVRSLIAQPLGDITCVAIDCGMDRDRLKHAQRTLRKRRERRDPLDLIAIELDTSRLAARRGEDVNDVATNGDLPALVDCTINTLVAHRHEPADEDVPIVRIAAADRKALWARRAARQLLDQRLDRDSDNAAFCQDRKRVRALAYEVRRRIEPRAPVDASVRQKSNSSRWCKSGDRVG